MAWGKGGIEKAKATGKGREGKLKQDWLKGLEKEESALGQGGRGVSVKERWCSKHRTLGKNKKTKD